MFDNYMTSFRMAVACNLPFFVETFSMKGNGEDEESKIYIGV